MLFLKGAEVIGHVAAAPVQLAVAGQLMEAAWAVGLMVLPEHRNGPVAPLLMRRFNEDVDIGLSLHVEQAALRVFRGVGWRHLGLLPQYVRVLNARAFVRAFARRRPQFLPPRWSRAWTALTRLSEPAAALLGAAFAALRVAGAIRRDSAVRRDAAISITEERRFDPGYTELAQRIRSKLGVWVFRDERYLACRYGPRMGTYRLLACRARDRLLGYCIVKIKQFADDPRMDDLRMGTIVDCVFDPDEPRILDALLGSVVALCRREAIDVVFCSVSMRLIRRHLRRHAFVRMPATLNVAVYDRTATIAGNVVGIESWHLMRGDSDADANC